MKPLIDAGIRPAWYEPAHADVGDQGSTSHTVNCWKHGGITRARRQSSFHSVPGQISVRNSCSRDHAVDAAFDCAVLTTDGFACGKINKSGEGVWIPLGIVERVDFGVPIPPIAPATSERMLRDLAERNCSSTPGKLMTHTVY